MGGRNRAWLRPLHFNSLLEGKEYVNWPIATFILAELENPTLSDVTSCIPAHRQIYVRFMRDAWQGPSRLSIKEAILCGRESKLSSIKPDVWRSVLEEALSCLNETKGYRGRVKQEVTLVSKDSPNGRKETKWVTPHLTIWTPIGLNTDSEAEIESAINDMMPLHSWLSNRIGIQSPSA